MPAPTTTTKEHHMSKLAKANAAHSEALRNGTAAEAAAAREAAIEAYDAASETEKDQLFPNRPKGRP
jgi:hypothetical protein